MNKDIQDNIKKLESIMGKQSFNLKIRPEDLNKNQEKVNHAFEDEASTSKNVYNMKSNLKRIFVLNFLEIILIS